MSYAPHPFTLRQLQYVVAVAEHLSFRRAAERCRVSQPALSAQLAQLEEVLGVQLFERDRRRVIVTAVGKELTARARLILRASDDLVEAARSATDPLGGTLRIGVIPTISPYLLPRVAPALRHDYPRLGLLWTEDKTDVLVQSLESGGLDAAVLAVEADIGELAWEELARDPFVLVTEAADPLGQKASPVTLPELHDRSVLLLDDGHCFREQALAVCTSAKARELEFRATSLSTLTQMVAGGAGVTLLPELSLATELRRADLRARPLAAPVPYRTIALAWRRTSPLADPLRRLSVTLRRAYPEGERPSRSSTSRSTSSAGGAKRASRGSRGLPGRPNRGREALP